MTEITVPIDFLRHNDLPGRCALTGEPTRSTYGVTVTKNRIWAGLMLVNPILGLVVRAFCDPVTLRVPLVRPLRVRRAVYGWLSLPACFAATTLVVVAVTAPAWPWVVGAAVACGTFAQLWWAYSRLSPAIWRDGDRVTMRVDAALAGALRGQVPPASGAPVGWYPDPSGVRQYRWWDGVRWTDRVAPWPDAVETPA